MSPGLDRESIFRSWLNDHRGIIAKVTRAFARSATETAELQQEIHLQLWKSVPAFSGDARASTWIYKVCLNTGSAWRRGLSRRHEKLQPAVDLAALASPSPSPDTSAADLDLLEKLYTAIHALEDFDRALVLLMLDGLSYREIADVIGITETHVGVALSRARKRLATHLKGITDELE